MPSSPLFPSSTESEVAEALLLLSKLQPFVWGSKRKRSICYKSESDSKISAKDESENKIVPKVLSPSSPLCFNCIADDPHPPPSEVPPTEVPTSEEPPRSISTKGHGEFLKEQKDRIAVLIQDNLTLQRTRFEMNTRYLILQEHNTWLKRMKEGLVLNRQFRSQIPVESKGNFASKEEMRRRMLSVAEERRRLWREGCAAARKRRRKLMRAKAGKKEDGVDENESRRWREGCPIARAARMRRMELMRTKVGKKRQRLG